MSASRHTPSLGLGICGGVFGLWHPFVPGTAAQCFEAKGDLLSDRAAAGAEIMGVPFGAAELVRELLDFEVQIAPEGGDAIFGRQIVHAEKFAQCGPLFKTKVRVSRNDECPDLAQIVRMVRKGKINRPGWYVREWLVHKSLRQADVVARTALGKGQVSEYVNGKRRWNQDVLEQFAHAIGIDPPDLLKPPQGVDNELAKYVMRMDERRRAQALRILKAAMGEEVA